MYLFSYSPKNQVNYEIDIEEEIRSNKEANTRDNASTKKTQANSPNFSNTFNSKSEIRKRNDAKNLDHIKASKSIGSGMKIDMNKLKIEANLDYQSIQEKKLFSTGEAKQFYHNPKSAIKNEETVKCCFINGIENCRSKSVSEIHNFPLVNERLKNRSFSIAKIN